MAATSKNQPLNEAAWQAACKHILSLPEPHRATFAPLITGHPHMGLASRGDPFETLIRSVVGQQISVKAADSVWAKLCATFPIQPEALHAAGQKPEALRACGLSGQKVRYITGIAEAFASGAMQPDTWYHMDDETLIRHLSQLPGIGRWTAEMFLMFHLLCPDVFPIDDLGILKAMERHYGWATQHSLTRTTAPAFRKANKALYQETAATWAPYRTVACWYLWRSLDPVPVGY